MNEKVESGLEVEIDEAEPAPAQDERPRSGVTVEKDLFGTVHIKLGDFDYIQIQYQYPYTDNASQNVLAKRIVELLTRPAQTEQQPALWQYQAPDGSWWNLHPSHIEFAKRDGHKIRMLYAAPIAQTAPQPEQGGLVEAAKAFADAARNNIYPCPDKPNSLSGKLQALDDAIATALPAQGGE